MTQSEKSTNENQDEEADSTLSEETSRYHLRLKDIYVPGIDWNRGAVGVTDLLSKTLDPLVAKRSLASAEIMLAWDTIVGPNFSDCSIIETIQWPYEKINRGAEGRGGVLVIRVDGPKSVYLQHEERQIIERANRHFGYHAIDRIKLVQAPITRPVLQKQKVALPDISERQKDRLRHYIPEFDNSALDKAMVKLGEAVFRRTLRDQ